MKLRAFFSITIALLALVSAQAQSDIETTDLVTLRDEKRGKNIELYAAWPKGDAKCPVILFSHGAGGSGSTYAPLIEDWAAHGYAVPNSSRPANTENNPESGATKP